MRKRKIETWTNVVKKPFDKVSTFTIHISYESSL